MSGVLKTAYNLSGVLDFENMTLTHTDKKGNETVYDLKEILEFHRNREIGITISSSSPIQSIEGDENE